MKTEWLAFNWFNWKDHFWEIQNQNFKNHEYHSQKPDLVQELKSVGLPYFSTVFVKSNWKRIFSCSLIVNHPKIPQGSGIIWKILDVADIIRIGVHRQMNCSQSRKGNLFTGSKSQLFRISFTFLSCLANQRIKKQENVILFDHFLES